MSQCSPDTFTKFFGSTIDLTRSTTCSVRVGKGCASMLCSSCLSSLTVQCPIVVHLNQPLTRLNENCMQRYNLVSSHSACTSWWCSPVARNRTIQYLPYLPPLRYPVAPIWMYHWQWSASSKAKMSIQGRTTHSRRDRR